MFIFADLQHGGDINAVDHTGQTALHWSAVRGAIQVAELLLQEGARVNVADMYGYQVCFLYPYLSCSNKSKSLFVGEVVKTSDNSSTNCNFLLL